MSQRSLLSRLMNSLRLSGDEDEDDYYLDDDDDMFEEDCPLEKVSFQDDQRKMTMMTRWIPGLVIRVDATRRSSR